MTNKRGEQDAPLVVAVGGGKGGVGKSVVAANLALAMAKVGARVTLVDADLGSSNLHTLFGLDRPGSTLQALFDGRADSLQEVVVPTGYPRLDLVPGSVAVPGAANVQHARKLKLLRHIAKLDAEVVVIDCGAGIHFNTLDFFIAADAGILVASAQLVSLQNAYGFLKASAYRLLRQQVSGDDAEVQILEKASDGSETETVRQLLKRIEAEDIRLASELRSRLSVTQITLLGNQLSDLRELGALHALARMIRDFLTLDAPVAGGILRSSRIHESVTKRKPFVSELASDGESRLLMQLAESYLCMNVRELREHRESLISAAKNEAELASRSSRPVRDSVPGAYGLPAPLGRYQRAHERFDVDWTVTVEAAGDKQRARLLDLSRGGAKLELSRPIVIAPELRVRIVFDQGKNAPSSILSARIVHRAELSAGCMFDPEPADAVIGELLARASRETQGTQNQAGSGGR